MQYTLPDHPRLRLKHCSGKAFSFPSFLIPSLPFFSLSFASLLFPFLPFLLWLSRCCEMPPLSCTLLSFLTLLQIPLPKYCTSLRAQLVSSLFQADARDIHESYTTEFVLLYPQGLWCCWPLSAIGSNRAERLFYMHLVLHLRCCIGGYTALCQTPFV